MFSPSGFRNLFQPSYCERRVWLALHEPDLATPDVDFIEMIQEKGIAAEEAHIQTVGPIEKPEYPELEFPIGFEETIKMIESKVPIIYQGILMSKDNQRMAIPDLMILDDRTEKYAIRDIKLARNLDAHPEIELGMGLCRIVAKEVLGYEPILEVFTGDGELLSPYIAPDNKIVKQCIKLISNLEDLTEEPSEISGWSKCSPCPFFTHCWDDAWKGRHVCTIPGVEQGMSLALLDHNIETWEALIKKGNNIAEIIFQRGSGTQRIGPTRTEKFLRQARCLSRGIHEKIKPLTLPNGYSPGDRPLVIFDVENNMPLFDELGLQVDVYLWGLLVVTDEEMIQKLIVAPRGADGDQNGWEQFLSTMSEIFKRYGDIPIIHFSSHEKTKVSNYLRKYGDANSIGQRVINNLWDLYRAILSSVALPVPSYGLKQIESFVGFKRTQEEYGGSWSIVRYNQYLEATSPDKAEEILNEIKVYNGEDLMATYEVYKWVENCCC